MKKAAVLLMLMSLALVFAVTGSAEMETTETAPINKTAETAQEPFLGVDFSKEPLTEPMVSQGYNLCTCNCATFGGPWELQEVYTTASCSSLVWQSCSSRWGPGTYIECL